MIASHSAFCYKYEMNLKSFPISATFSTFTFFKYCIQTMYSPFNVMILRRIFILSFVCNSLFLPLSPPNLSIVHSKIFLTESIIPFEIISFGIIYFLWYFEIKVSHYLSIWKYFWCEIFIFSKRLLKLLYFFFG